MAHPDQHLIVGIHITDRITRVPDVQGLLSEYGCNIRTRLGLHDASADYCSPNGVILLEMVGDMSICRELIDKLGAIDGIQVKQMLFDHR